LLRCDCVFWPLSFRAKVAPLFRMWSNHSRCIVRVASPLAQLLTFLNLYHYFYPSRLTLLPWRCVFLRNVCTYLPDCTVSRSIRPPKEIQILHWCNLTCVKLECTWNGISPPPPGPRTVLPCHYNFIIAPYWHFIRLSPMYNPRNKQHLEATHCKKIICF
jgi:hypothetical protein